MVKFRKSINDIIYISKITNVTKKKIRILSSVFLSNITVLIDILIILLFANLLTGETSNIEFINIFVTNI